MKASEVAISDLIEKARADEGSLSVDEIEVIERYKAIKSKGKPARSAKKDVGTPKAATEAEEVERMAGLCAKDQWIADALGISIRSVQRKYSVIMRKARALRRMKLLEAQWAAVEKGVPAMLIWTSKQILEWKDLPDAPVEKEKAPVLKIVRPGETLTAKA